MSAAVSHPDFSAIKQRQQATWASGDYSVVGTTLQIVGERLCEAVDLRSSERVLDVAAGNGNATLAAARRWADVTSTDYVGALLDRGRERAAAERLAIKFQEADAEALPFADGSFDVVLSTFGVMFAPNQEKAASELARASAARTAASASPTGRLKDSSASFSRSSASMCRRLLACSRRPYGAPSHDLKNCLRAIASRQPGRSSISGTSRPGTGWKSSRPTTVPPTAPLRHSMPANKMHCKAI